MRTVTRHTTRFLTLLSGLPAPEFSAVFLGSAAPPAVLDSSYTSTLLIDSTIPQSAQTAGWAGLRPLGGGGASSGAAARLPGSTPLEAPRPMRAATPTAPAAAMASDRSRAEPDWWLLTASIDALRLPLLR